MTMLRLRAEHSGAVVEIDVLLLNAIIHNATRYTPPDKMRWPEVCGMVDLHRAIAAAVEKENAAIRAIADARIEQAIQGVMPNAGDRKKGKGKGEDKALRNEYY